MQAVKKPESVKERRRLSKKGTVLQLCYPFRVHQRMMNPLSTQIIKETRSFFAKYTDRGGK